MGRKSKEEYDRIMDNVMNSFRKHPSYWGIDKVVLGNICILNIDKEKLCQKDKELSDRQCKVIANPDDQTLLSVKICQKDYTLYTGRSKTGDYVIITLLVDEPNVKTQNASQIKAHLVSVVDKVREDFGISLYAEEATVKSIEIAYTTISDEVPIWAASFVMEAFYKRGRAMSFIKPSKTKHSATYGSKTSGIMVKNTRAAKTGSVYKWYDKTREMLDKGEIADLPSELSGIRIYRFESTIQDAYVKKSFGTNVLRQMTDEKVLDYIGALVNHIADNYRKQYLLSVHAARNQLHMSKADNKERIKTNNILKDLIKTEGNVIKTEKMTIIDAESYLYASPGGPHGSRRIWKYLESMSESYLTEMYGWVAEDIINDMLDAYQTGLGEGLGCHYISDTDLKVNTFGYNAVNKSEQQNYFRYLMKTKTRYKYMQEIAFKKAVS